MSIRTSRAILLRSYPYSETSRIFRFLTADLGVVGIIARGARKGGGRGRGAIDTFDEGELTFHFRENRDLQTFRDFSPTRSRRGLASNLLRFAGASVLAELVLRHAGEEESEELFGAVRGGLDRIEGDAGEDPLPRILAEGWRIVDALGYAPVLDDCVQCGRALDQESEGGREEAEEGGEGGEGEGKAEGAGEAATGAPGRSASRGKMARFDFASGGMCCARCGKEGEGPRIGPVARSHLRALLEGRPPEGLPGSAAHLRLFSDFVTYHVSDGRRLNALDFLTDLSG